MLRKVGVAVVGFGWLWIALSPQRRRALARKLVVVPSHRIVDEDARAAAANEAWEDEGGAMRVRGPSLSGR